MMQENQTHLDAYLLNSTGGTSALSNEELEFWKESQGPLWLNLDRTAEYVEPLLKEILRLDPIVVEALLAEDTSPRFAPHGNGYMLSLRGVNLNRGADPSEMISVRIWFDSGRVVTLRRQELMAIQDIRELFARSNGPTRAGEFVALLAVRLAARIAPTIAVIEDRFDEIEEIGEELNPRQAHDDIISLRRTIITIRRYLSPQREMLHGLVVEKTLLLEDEDRRRLREAAAEMIRFIEDLDALRERATLLLEGIAATMAERMNRRIFWLTIIAGLFMPLTFITGLLGINVGGIPGAETEWAFTAVAVGIGITLIVEIIVVWRLRLFS